MTWNTKYAKSSFKFFKENSLVNQLLNYTKATAIKTAWNWLWNIQINHHNGDRSRNKLSHVRLQDLLKVDALKSFKSGQTNNLC